MTDAFPKANVITATEYVVALRSDKASAGAKFGRTRTMIVPLMDKNKNWLWAPYMHVVVRMIAQNGLSAPTCRVIVQYRGTTL